MDPHIAVDAPLENRPGVPKETWPPPAYGGAVPVTSNLLAPRGLAGVVRRAAYRLPDHRARRWLYLLLADRIDAQEARIRDVARRPATWVFVLGLAGIATGVALRLRRR